MSKTSFFNKAVFKRNLRGFWPLWAVYLGALILLIPVPVHSSLMYPFELTAEKFARNYFDTALTVSLVAGAFFAIFAAMAVFSYMYTPRAANMTASLPVKRETHFSTCFITIMFVVIASHIITAITLILTIVMVDVNMLLILPILQWLILGILMTMFFVCLSCFCATLTGSLLILPCIYGVINFSVITINYLLSNVFADFLYGYTQYALPGLVSWLTPSVRLMQEVTFSPKFAEGANYILFGGTTEVIVYTVAGIILLIAGLFIHRTRRTESASDVIAIKPLKPVVKFFFAAVGSLSLGLLINALFFSYISDSWITHLISMLIGGFVGYFASEMLVTKTFKVWHKWKGFVIYALVVILFITGLAFDIAGFETSIPRNEIIEYASVDIYGESIDGDDIETLSIIRDLHQYIIENRDKEVDYEQCAASVDITYRLRSGGLVKRSYYCNLPDFIVEAFNTPQRCYERVALSTEFNLSKLEQASVEYYDGNEWQVIPITEEQFYEIYNRMISDIGTSSVGKFYFNNSITVEDAFVLSAEFGINKYSGFYYFYQRIPADAANCLEYLDYLGIGYVPVY